MCILFCERVKLTLWKKNETLRKTTSIFVVLIVCCVYIIFGCCLANGYPIDPDKATHLQQGLDIIQGNFFLNNWILSGVNFITTDLPFYMVGGLLGGLDYKSIVIATGLMISLWGIATILAANVYIRDHRRGTFCLSVLLLSVPCFLYGAFLRVHTGAMILSLLAEICVVYIVEHNGQNIISYILVFLLIFLGCIGDILTVILGVLPVIAFSIINIRKERRRYFTLIVVVIGALIFALLFDRLYYIFGTADKNSYIANGRTFLSISEWSERTESLLLALLDMTNGNFSRLALGNPESVLRGANAVLVVLGLIVLLGILIDFLRGRVYDSLSVLLCLSVVFASIVYITTELSAERYICFIPYALYIILARNYKKLFISLEISRKLVISIVFVLAVVCFSSRLMNMGDFQCKTDEYEHLIDVLTDNELLEGYTSFENAAILRVLSNGTVQMAPIEYYGTNNMGPLNYFSDYDWLEQENPCFIVASDEPYYHVNQKTVKECYGEPKDTIDVDRFQIMLYEGTLPLKNLLDNELNRFDMSGNEAVETRATGIILHPSGIVYGPYCQLRSGYYSIFINGSGLDGARSDVFSGKNNDVLVYSVIEQHDDQIQMQLSCSEDIDDFEVRLFNEQSSTDVVFTNVIINECNRTID